MKLEMAVGADALQCGRDRRVVRCGGGKSLLRQTPLGSRGKLATRSGHLFGNRGVVRGRGHHCHVLKILGRRADHRGSANIDVLDELLERHACLGCSLLKRVKIDHNHVDGLDAMLGHGATVRGILAPVQDAAVHFGVQGFDPPIEHFRKAGEFGNVFYADPRVAQQLGRAAGRNKFHTHAGELAGEVHQSRLVRHAENGALNLRLGRRHSRPR